MYRYLSLRLGVLRENLRLPPEWYDLKSDGCMNDLDLVSRFPD
ncbi:hypothetical protein D1BOALGB6SA_9801 [Olavius sp. associated proteobacterium Delta 1]|nr:hypothetical protein D1BOALGB6SA_9801 [Olavius sp. associated proteobacterium Delta 1]